MSADSWLPYPDALPHTGTPIEPMHHIRAWLTSPTIENTLDTAIELERANTAQGFDYAGRVLLELAGDPAMPLPDQVLLLEAARNNWVRAAGFRMGFRQTSAPHSIEAAAHLANLPNYYGRVLEGKVPRTEAARRAYHGLVEVGERQVADILRLPRHAKLATHEFGRAGMFGSLAEIDVLLLLQRFAIQQGGRRWLAVHSEISQDMSLSDGSDETRRWDITLFEQRIRVIPPTIKSRIQVKSHRYDGAMPAYTPDVPVIYVAEDFQLNDFAQIVRDCRHEARGESQKAVRRLNARTDVLMDRLGLAA